MDLRPASRRRLQREALPLDAESSLALREFTHAFSFYWHYHPEIELVAILSGRGVRFVGDSIQDYHAGDLCLVGPHVPHSWFTLPDSRGEAHRSLVLQFRVETFGREFLALPEWRRVREMLARSRLGLAVLGLTRERVTERLLRMRELPAGSLGRLAELLAILEALATSGDVTPLATAPHALDATADAQRRINAVFAYLDEHLGDVLSQRAVARRLRMSPSAFSRFFRRATGKTFGAYVNELRVSVACRSLLETDTPIFAVAAAVGFTNLSHFNRRFRALKGTTPRAYRRQARAAATSTADRVSGCW